MTSRLCPLVGYLDTTLSCLSSRPLAQSSAPLHSAPLDPLTPRDASSPVPPAVPPGVGSGSNSESDPDPVVSDAASFATSCAAAVAIFSLASLQPIPGCSHHRCGTRVPRRLSATLRRNRFWGSARCRRDEGGNKSHSGGGNSQELIGGWRGRRRQRQRRRQERTRQRRRRRDRDRNWNRTQTPRQVGPRAALGRRRPWESVDPVGRSGVGQRIDLTGGNLCKPT